MIEETEDIYDEFKETYDANVLNTDSEEKKEVYRGLAEVFYDYHPLAKLMYNKFVSPSLKRYDYISGPGSLTLQTHAKSRKKIYIFGEQHFSPLICPGAPTAVPIVDFLKELFTKTPVFIDFYLEFGGYTGKSYSDIDITDTKINNIFKNFQKCFDFSERHAKECSVYRAHYIDIRVKYEDKKYKIVSPITELGEGLRYISTRDFPNEVIKLQQIQKYLSNPSFLDILNKIFNLDRAEAIQYLIEENFKSNIKVKKELEKSKLGKKIIEVLLEELRIYYLNNVESVRNILNSINTDPNFFLNNIGKVSEFLIYINTYSTDAYTLARIFRKFNIENDPHEMSVDYDQPEKPRNIVIYVGEFHASTLRKFLQTQGFKLEGQSNAIEPKVESTCVSVQFFKQPFFS